MAYDSKWWTLAQTLEQVMPATRNTEDEVKADICRALADRAIDFLSKLDKQHPPRSMTSDAVLEGDDFDIPHEIKPEKLDWVNSRPLEPWPVRRGGYKIPGLWWLEWIMLSSSDVTNQLCGPRPQGVADHPAPPASSGSHIRGDTRSMVTSGTAAPKRRRGRRPVKFENTMHAMRTDIQERRRSVADLANMLQKELEATYDVSRDTARKARDVVLQEFDEN
jgi:hypothetical protein